MMIAPGSRLGPYEITAKLGEGGMGEVYRATDTRLDREVAIKVLPAAFTADRERLARFEREAKLLAQLHHPNIASIFGLEESDGVRALVMELVVGEDLAARMARGPLPIDEALSIARQIAEALEEAHEHGIVHRDLKPANVKLTTDGRVKVLDFGLAKALDPSAGTASPADLARSPTLMNSPTLTAPGTQLGVILGTAAYMAPEQARGGTVDKRADIWAFGVVLFEMLTGRRLFAGETVSDTLAAVLRADVDFRSLPPETPGDVRRVLRRCLERNPKLRLRDVGEARVALDPSAHELVADPAPAAAAAAPRTTLVARVLPWAIVALLLVGLVWAVRRPSLVGAPTTTSPVLALRLPPGISIPIDESGIYGQTGVLAIAPDGGRVAFVEGITGKGPIVIRDLDREEYRLLDGTDGASSPFFSPDGKWIGYFAPGKLRKIAVDGGRPIDLADASLDRGAVWCPDGSIVYAPGPTLGLFRLPPGGGPPQPLTRVDAAHGERTHRWPAVLRGGHEVAFTVGRADHPGDYDGAQIDAVDLATGKRRALFRGASMIRFTSNGFALLGRNGEVLALPLASAKGQSAEDAPPVLRHVAGVPASGVVHFDVANDGTLVYAERDPHADELELVWYGAAGEPRPLDLPRGQYREVRFSPDGRKVALSVGPGGGRGGDVAILDLASGALQKVTFDGKSWSPAWSRDGKSLTYETTLASGAEEFRTKPVDGSREATTIVHFDTGKARGPTAWMPDGSLLFWEDGGAGSGGNIVYLPPGSGEPRPFASTAATEIQPRPSPDGRFVAYDHDDSGLASVYVQPFPPSGAKWLVAEGASVPLWSADGRELYFAQGHQLMAVPVSAAGAFSLGSPRSLFEFPVNALLTHDTSTTFDVAPDGRILTARTTSTEPMNDHLVVVLNWFARLKQATEGGR